MIKRIGFNPTGKNYYDFVPPERKQRAIETVQALIDVPCGLRAFVEQTYSSGLGRTVEIVLLPLVAEAPEIDGYILSASGILSDQQMTFHDDAVLLGKRIIDQEFIDLGFGVEDIIPDLQ